MRHASYLSIVCLLAILSPLFSGEPFPSSTAKIADRDRPETKEAWGKDVSKDRNPVPEISVRHREHTSDGWSVAESANFQVFHNRRPDFAEKLIKVAEKSRVSAQRKWFGSVDEDWSPRCEIYLHETGDDFSQATGAPPNVPGYTTTTSDEGRVVSRRIDLCYQDPNLLTAVLPHEAIHAALAGRFGWFQVPRWANEGMAVLGEPEAKIDVHLRRLARYRKDGDLFPAEQLLQIKEYPEKRLLGAFYAESVSLVDFLTKEKGPKVFYRFMCDGLRDGYSKAIRRNYGWDISELDDRWREFAFGRN